MMLSLETALDAQMSPENEFLKNESTKNAFEIASSETHFTTLQESQMGIP